MMKFDLSNLIKNLNFEKLIVDETILHSVDVRVKLFACVVLIFTISSMIHYEIPLLIFATFLIISYSIGIPFKITVQRLISPFFIVLMIFIVLIFTYGGEKTILNLYGLSIPIYSNGLHLGILIFARLIASILILNILIATTRIQDVLIAMRWFKVPKVFVDLMGMMIRYISLLSKEVVRMYNAQQSRLAYSKRLSYRIKIKNIGILAGSLLIRAFSRGEKVYLAMLSRGYGDDSRVVARAVRISFKEILFASSIIIICIGLIIADRFVIQGGY